MFKTELEPTYCLWCGNEEDMDGHCRQERHCPPTTLPCPVCVDHGKLQGHDDRLGIQCDSCNREFTFDNGVLNPDEPIQITLDDISLMFSNFEDSEDKLVFWKKIRTFVMQWDEEVMNND